MATTAPIRVLIKLTNSFVNQGIRPCSDAPMYDSAVVAINAAIRHAITAFTLTIMPKVYAKPVNTNDPITPARVPSTLTAPSVPGGTLAKVVIRYVVLPYALPMCKL